VALKSGLSEAEAQEVVQETLLRVAKKVKDFQYDRARGSFKGWLLQLTGWQIANQSRKRLPVAPPAAAREAPCRTGLMDRISDGEAGLR
jgi:DNA-directed RNA polymerase specialized sigma24 family protein